MMQLLFLNAPASVIKYRNKAVHFSLRPVIVKALSSSIEDLLREKFIETMKSNNSKIFSSWPNFEKSLPRRQYNVKKKMYLPLFKLGYYARDDDLQRFADEIMQPPKKSEQSRVCVKYIAAPSSSGKTTCILPAFFEDNPYSLFLHCI